MNLLRPQWLASDNSCELRLVSRRLSWSNKDEFRVATKSDGWNWIEHPIHWRADCGHVVCGYWIVQCDWKYFYCSTNFPRTMGTDILGLLAGGDCRLLPKLRCLFRGLNSCLAD